MRAIVLLLPPRSCWRRMLLGPALPGVAHIAIFAADYEKSRAFYRDFLGFEEPYSLSNAGRHALADVFQDQRAAVHRTLSRKEARNRSPEPHLDRDRQCRSMRRYLASRGVAVPEAVGKGPDRQFQFQHEGSGRPYDGDRPVRTGRLDGARAGPASRREAHLDPHDARRHHRDGSSIAEMKFYQEVLGFQRVLARQFVART